MTKPLPLKVGDRVRTDLGTAKITHISTDDWYMYRYEDDLGHAGYRHRSRLRKLPDRKEG